MNRRIRSELKNIELRENIKIIYACEYGCRGWGFPSKDSAYDVRFIYVRPMDSYLSIFDKTDVIERPVNDFLGFNGWDIRKALQLLSKSYPPPYEWIQSPVVYLENSQAVEQIRSLAKASFDSKACIYHYLSKAKGNLRQYLQGDYVTPQKYFYVLRSVLACRWITTNNTMPPTDFEKLVTFIQNEQLLTVIYELLNSKKTAGELDCIPKIEELNEFLIEEISYFDETVKKLEQPAAANEALFDQAFITILKTYGVKLFSKRRLIADRQKSNPAVSYAGVKNTPAF